MDSEDDIPALIEHKDTVKDDPAPQQDEQAKRVPLTIICGFLGAGKSTLLKRILTEKHGYRIAVIMNEFADTADIEARAINISSPDDPEAANSEEFLELPNGCLCCSIKDQGAAAIEKLMQRKGAFDHILLETTGLADPGPIASMFWKNEEYAVGLGRDIVLDGVICVVDAVFGKQQMMEDKDVEGLGESLRQIAGSDVIILNKIDLVAPAALPSPSPSPPTAPRLSETEEAIRHVNPFAPIHKTSHAQVGLEHIIGIGAYSSVGRQNFILQASQEKNSEPETEQRDQTQQQQHIHGPECDHGHDGVHHSEHYELRGISSLQVYAPLPLEQGRLELLDEWIRNVLWEGRLPSSHKTERVAGDNSKIESPLQVLRCKGIWTMQTGERYILQGVRELYEVTKLPANKEDIGVGEGKIVLIGKGLGDVAVRNSLEKVLYG